MTSVYDDVEYDARTDRDRFDLADRYDDRPSASDLAAEGDDLLTCAVCRRTDLEPEDACGHYAADMCRGCAIEGGCKDCTGAARLELAEAGW